MSSARNKKELALVGASEDSAASSSPAGAADIISSFAAFCETQLPLLYRLSIDVDEDGRATFLSCDNGDFLKADQVQQLAGEIAKMLQKVATVNQHTLTDEDGATVLVFCALPALSFVNCG